MILLCPSDLIVFSIPQLKFFNFLSYSRPLTVVAARGSSNIMNMEMNRYPEELYMIVAYIFNLCKKQPNTSHQGHKPHGMESISNFGKWFRRHGHWFGLWKKSVYVVSIAFCSLLVA